MQDINFSKITLAAIEIALQTGDILKKGFSTSFKISKKEGRHNLVTEYDLLSEKKIIEFINQRFYDHSILSEEKGEVQSKGEYKWIIDPLDGTVNFAHSIPFFSVSIGIKKNDDLISSVIYAPLLNELFVAEKGKGAYLNGQRIFVSNTKNIDDAILATGFPYDLINNPNQCLDYFVKIAKLGLPIRRLGCASLDLAYVASGRFDVFWETGLGPWDCAGGILLIEEANGKITNWDNSKIKLQNKNAVIATNSYLHESLIDIFRDI